jgi:hypothetical protein
LFIHYYCYYLVERPFDLSVEGVASNAPPGGPKRQGMLGLEPGGELLAAPLRSAIKMVIAGKAGIEGVDVLSFARRRSKNDEYENSCRGRIVARVMPNDRTPNESLEARIQELHRYLAKMIGLVGVISPAGSFSAIAERQTPLPGHKIVDTRPIANWNFICRATSLLVGEQKNLPITGFRLCDLKNSHSLWLR